MRNSLQQLKYPKSLTGGAIFWIGFAGGGMVGGATAGEEMMFLLAISGRIGNKPGGRERPSVPDFFSPSFPSS